MPALKPTGLNAKYLRECFDVLSIDPPVLRWRVRPVAHFRTAWPTCRTWNNNFAGHTLRPLSDGQMRVKVGGRVFNAKRSSPRSASPRLNDQQGMPEGAQTSGSPTAWSSPGAGRSPP